ncbi:molecular chaperone [Gibbsiella greigii]
MGMMKKLSALLLFTLCLISAGAKAGIIASATRVVFNQGDNEKSLMLVNTNAYPIMVQTWVDNGDVNAAPELSNAPFVSLPSVFSMQPGTLRGLRLIYGGQTLPTDRESVFWLNLYEIPPNQPTTPPQKTRVTLAMNTQMKIFYRPKTLAGQAASAPDKITFTLRQAGKHHELICKNSSAFYLSFAQLSVRLGNKDYPVRQESDMMTAPFSSKRYFIDNANGAAALPGTTVKAAIINDLGHQIKRQYFTL